MLVVDAATRTAPSGLRDSKLLTPAAREALAPKVRRWAVASAVGHAEPDEIDAIGIIAALRLAGRRALAQLPVLPDLVILDGNHDWLSDPREPSLLDGLEGAVRRGCPARRPPVTTRIKADVSLRGGGRGQRAGQDDPRRDDDRCATSSSRTTAGPATRATARRTTSRPSPRTAAARSTAAAGGCRVVAGAPCAAQALTRSDALCGRHLPTTTLSRRGMMVP